MGSMKKEWSKYDSIGAIITGMNVIVGIVMYFTLDGNIAIQWSGTDPTSIVSKNYIFLFPLIAVVFLFVGKGILQYVSYKWFKDVNHLLIDYANMFLQVIFITVAGILIIEIIIGFICGMRLRRK